jgi:hypothetical protein
MTYYDLLKQYVSTGKKLNYDQFSKITNDGGLLSSYLYSRGKIGKKLSDYEYAFLKNDKKHLPKLGKDGLVALYKRNSFRDEILDIIVNRFVNLLNSNDVAELMDYDEDDDYSHHRSVIGVLYGKRPELFNSLGSRIALVNMDIIGCKDVGDLGGNFKVKVDSKYIPYFFGNGREYKDLIGLISGDEFSEYEYNVPEMDWRDIIRNYVDEKNMDIIIRYVGYNTNYGKEYLMNIDNLIDAIEKNEDRFKIFINKIKQIYKNTIVYSLNRKYYDIIEVGLSYYGNVDKWDSFKVILDINMGKLMEKFGDNSEISLCGYESGSEYFEYWLYMLSPDKKPVLNFPEKVELDKFDFNYYLTESFGS